HYRMPDSTAWRAELRVPGVLSVCSYTAFEPMTHGDGKGFEADLLRAAARVLEISVRFHPTDVYEQICMRAFEGTPPCDVVSGGRSARAARRAEGVAFSRPHSRNLQTLLVRADDPIRDYADLRAAEVIGVVPGSTGKLFALERAREVGLDPARCIKDYPT